MNIPFPIFTVIVPTYNQANFLPAALDSLLVQTDSNWEAVVVNDGSTDNTAQVLEAYAARDQRIRVVHQQNGGVAAALNTALRHARGEWICWLSSDDLFEPDKLAVHATFAAENSAVRFMYTSFSLLYDETGVQDINALNTSVIPPQELQVLQLFRFNYVNGISVAVHREVFERVGQFSEYLKNGQDYDMWLRISAHFQLYFINKRTSITRVHPSQGTNLFVEAGIYDSCQAGLNFLNQHGFAALFPFLDLRRAENVLFAIQHVVGVLTEPAAYINRCGGAQAMADRLHEWLSESPAEIRAVVKPYLEEVVRIVAQSGLPETIRRVFCSLEPVSVSFKYQRHDFFELLRQHIQNLERANHNEAPAMRKYLSYYFHDAEQSPPPDQQIPDNTAPAHGNHFFIESALAHKYCIGKGLEIGGSAHNPFGLNTLNVDFSDSMDTIYKQEEVRACGKAMPVDIVALGDNIPLPNESQDFIVSSHVLEHFPNPIKALKEWYRLIKPGGIIFMIVPHKERTFDSVQPRTTLEHLVQDYYNDETKFHENPQGHDHCWITEDILELLKWMTSHLDMHWTLVEVQDVDDKVGNGFTIALKKDDDLPMPVVGKPTPSEFEPKSVLLVVHGFPPTEVGGVEVYTQNLAKEMTSRGVRVTVLYPTTDSLGTAYSITSNTVGGLTLTRLHVPRGNLFTGIISQDIDSAFGNFLKSHSFDLVHFHHIFEHMSISMIATAKKIGVPVALTLHDFWFICPRAQLFIEENGTVCSGPESPAKCAHCVCRVGWCSGLSEAAVEEAFAFRQAYVRELLLKVDLLFSPSRFVADVFNRYAFGDNRITVAPLGIGKFAVNRSSSHDCPRFGFMGTIHPVKNILSLVRAFTATYGKARLDIFGGGETQRVNELRNCISDSRITYHGSYTSEQLPEILSNIDVLVVPSLIESYCLTVREALSAGIPVLAARVGGIPEIIRDGVNGILFDPFDNRELTGLLQKFINDRSLFQQLDGNAISVKTIATDAQFMLEQYAGSMNSSGERIPETNGAAVEQISRPSHGNPVSKMPGKIVVAVFSLDHHEQACGHYRVYAPFKGLSDSIEVLQGIIIKDNEYTIKQKTAISADVIVVQRFFPRSNTTDFLDWLCSLGKPVIFEIDDLLTKLPSSNPSYGWGMDSAPHIYNFIKKCAAVAVSTEELRKQFSEYNDVIQILPNMIDDALWCKPAPKSSGPIVIGYAGTITHATDLELVEGVLERIAQRYGNSVSFTFMGCTTERLARLPGFNYIKFEVEYEAYARRLQEIPVDIMLIPLEDNEFNRCKSNIKWLEYSACGYAGIYADLAPYNTSVEHGRTGLLVGNNPQQWYEAISLLIENDELRRSIVANARAEVLTRYTVAANAYKWLDTYQTIIRNHMSAQPASRIKVSLIVLTWNRARMLDQCLAAITNSVYYSDSYELIVGDNGSDVNTQEVLAKYKIHKLIRRETNEGLELYKELYAAAAGDIIIEIDDDVIDLPLHFDRDMAYYFEVFPDYGLIGLDVIQNEYTNGAKPDGRYYGRDIRSDLEIEQGPVVGCCMAIRRILFDSFGGFSGETLSLARSQDWVLADRVNKKGLHAGIMRGVKCFHACGPYYAAQFGRQALEVHKYQVAGQHDRADSYASFSREATTSSDLLLAPVSIIIPLFNNMADTRQCLEHLCKNTVGERYELILVDNGCTDDTYKLFDGLPASVKVIRNIKNQGFAKACNQGAQVASGKYLLFLNNDTEPQPGWLEPLLNTAEQDAGIAAVGGKLLYPDGTIQHAGVVIGDDRMTSDPLEGRHIYQGYPGGHPDANITREYQALTAACLLVRRDAFEAAHGFDEGYWNGYEDVDLCFKLGQKGWKRIYQPASVVVHHESKSGSERFAKAVQNIQRLHEKWLGIILPDVIIHPDASVEWLYGEALVAKPLVSIIIPLFNQAQLTKASIEAIRTTAGDPRRYELVLVDNGSRDWTPEYLRSLGDSIVVIANQENLGFAKACNQGALLAKGEYLLFLNNDTVPQPGWLDALLAGVREEGADIVGAKLLYPNGKVQHAGVAFNRNGIGYHIFKNFDADTPAVNKKRFMQCVTAACMLVSKQLFNELGGLDEQFRNGFEDVDFCLRAGQDGKRILYNPNAVLIHHEEQSEGRKQHDLENMQRYLTRWQGLVHSDDEELYANEGFSIEWHADGTCVVRPRSVQQVIHESSRYPLIPLVGHSSSSILQKLSSSQRTKGVLKRYTVEE